MRKLTLILLPLTVLMTSVVNAQTTFIEGQNTAKITASIDFSAASATAPVRVTTTIPPTCTVGQLFFKQDATPGSNMYGCTSSNTWTLMSGAGGPGGGGVSSVAMTVPSFMSITGSPITSSGTLAVDFISGPNNRVLAYPNGTSGVPVFRSLQPPDLPSIITSSTTGQALTAAALAGTPTLCPAGQAPTGIISNGNATGCAVIGGGSSSSNSFSIAFASNTATLTCASPNNCGVQVGNDPQLHSGASATYSPAGGGVDTFTGHFCLGDGAISFAYNSATGVGSSTGLTIVPGASTCPDYNVELATVTVVNSSITATTLINPRYFIGKKVVISNPYGTPTDDGKTITYTLPPAARNIATPRTLGTGGSSVLLTADLTLNGFFINDTNARTMTEASCLSDTGSQTITVKIGATTAFAITCVVPGSYSASTTDGTTGYMSAANMTNTAIASHIALNQSGTANGSTHNVWLHVWAQ